jgi:nitrite reductase/ring-hydroxylating ferredoxin subunit
MAWLDLGLASQVPEDSVRELQSADGRDWAVVHATQHEWFALENRCPHLGAPLGHGHLVGHLVVCPWHAWPVDCRTGCVAGAEGIEVDRYQVRQTDGRLELNDQKLSKEPL